MYFFWRWLAAARRLLNRWAVFETYPDDVVWPTLRDYPYRSPTR
jgi:hypothetical protein